MALSRIRRAAQSERSASSYSTRSDASVPLSSLPWTLPATQRMAGVRRTIPARADDVVGERSARTSSRMEASREIVTLRDRPTIAYRNGLPCWLWPAVPVITRVLASSTACR